MRASLLLICPRAKAPGRAGRVHIDRDGDDIWIGGNSVTVVNGTIELADLG
jgi:predicted PhzF superfamily epimerase YddE/YHI9